jgi:hypothetical protein
MREVQLRRMRQRKTVWVLGALALLALGALWWWAAQRPPSIVIPPRQYPPNNAYDAYKQIAQDLSDLFNSDARLRDIESRLFGRGNPPVSQADKRYFLQKMQPFLEAYQRHMEQPCVAVYEYDWNWRFTELAEFRRLARAESLAIRDALEAGREDEALTRVQALLRFGEQIRTEGILIHYMVGLSVSWSGLEPLREHLPQIQSPRTLASILALARDAEQRHTPVRAALTQDYYFGLALYRDLARGKIKPQDLKAGGFDNLNTLSPEAILMSSPVSAPFVMKPSLREYQHYYDQLFAEFEKPPWERKPVPTNPKRLLNQLLFPVFQGATLHEQSGKATVRLLGCYAAVKRYRQQRGAYPPSLEALRPELGEIIIDPFTGKPFVYRTDPKRGFQLYSVGENLTDDGGRLSANRQQGDLLPITENALPEAQRPTGNRLSVPVWLR